MLIVRLVCHAQARMARVAAEAELNAPFANELPSRQAQLAALQATEEFDVLVIGGGATGAGCALDAVTRSKLTATPHPPTPTPPGTNRFQVCNCPRGGRGPVTVYNGLTRKSKGRHWKYT